MFKPQWWNDEGLSQGAVAEGCKMRAAVLSGMDRAWKLGPRSEWNSMRRPGGQVLYLSTTSTGGCAATNYIYTAYLDPALVLRR